MSKNFSKTSLEAYKGAKNGLILAHQQKILKALIRIKSGNYEDIARAAGLEKHKVARRLSELEPDKIIKITKKKKTESGYPSCIYRLA